MKGLTVLARRGVLVAVAVAAIGSIAASGAVGGTKDRSDGKQLSKIQHIVVVYEENHSFDNLYGGWEGVNGRANADAARTNQIAQNGLLVQLPAAERREPDVASAGRRLHGHEHGHAVQQSLHERAVLDRGVHPEGCAHVPAARSVRSERPAAEPGQSSGRLHAATSCIASTRSSTSSTAASRTCTRPAATPSD